MSSVRYIVAISVLVAMVGCGGGSSSGGGVSLGSGQDSDPVVMDFPIAYVQRALSLDDDGNLQTTRVRDAVTFQPGAALVLRERASASAQETNLTIGVFPDDVDGNPALYDVKDLSVSFDGSRMVFAMRAPFDPDLEEDEQPTWNIWLYDHANATLDRVIESDITAELGQDVAPAFLPDGRIVFSSSRQRTARAVLLDEGKPQFSALDEDRDDPALALHVMNEDGSDIRQITFNQSSDLDPTVLGDGRIAFSRWDNVAGVDRVSLYTVLPDGRDLQLLYGYHSHDTGPDGDVVEFVEAREMPDGRLLTLLKPPGDQARMGSLPVAIDVTAYTDHDQPTFNNAGLLSDAQEVLIPGDLNLDDDDPPLQGRYAAVTPLFDGSDRLLTSWSQCRLVDNSVVPAEVVPCTDENLANPNMEEADPLYGVWMYDIQEQTQQPIAAGVEGLAYSEVVVFEPRTAPPVLLDGVAGIDLDGDLVGESAGVLHIRSVYDFDGNAALDIATVSDPALTPADARPARFVRLVKAVSMPDDDLVDLDGTDFGRSSAQLMREVLGYAPVEPDGSVKVKVPANVAFWVEVLDADGRRISARHNNWLHVRPGEEYECVGCHEQGSQLPHGRYLAQAPSVNEGALVNDSPFPNTEAALAAQLGESMAEVFARVMGVRDPSMDVVFTDVWTDPGLGKDADIAYEYSALTTQAPVDPSCVSDWQSACRITINYEEHIHPLWSVDRQVFDAGGALVRDDTCTACHAAQDSMGLAMVPAAQLDLSDGTSDQEPEHFASYRELLFTDNEQELDLGGVVIDRLVQALDVNGDPLFEVDANGDLILDGAGDPIPVLVPIGVAPSLSVAGANLSPAFFDLFDPLGTHAGRLSGAELKLVSEWIDVGGQYYNNPFDVPP